MRKPIRPVFATAAATGAFALGLALTPAAADATPASRPHPHPHRAVTIKAVEKGTAINMVDVAPADSALGDQLIGTGDLTTPAGRELGTSSFVGVSTDAKPRTAELLTFVYELPDGKITTSGTARLSATGPVFDEKFAITGGTGAYKNATGQVRVVQETVERAKVTFSIHH
ncbi:MULTISPECIES: allene oxide cyclase barrel-like domain-containing protein [Streptomyces]|uniref:Allene oxide cyclase barrel-like domain-containing protein n=1 Tax=Streptomyces griseiscabiei TaxID=2993540 RepID=A0ABU4L798_9ACTN|nr:MULTISPECIES: hypothetical protein [Streptomyces]MDX2911205.1 hypothetical protein [Streptomyces griseiscabiei]